MSLTNREKESLAPRKRGRPALFEDAHNERAFKLALLGLDDSKIADIFGISERTFLRWKRDAPGFLAALLRGRDEADSHVAHSMYQRAVGYSHPAVKIMQYEGIPIEVEYTEHYPPDTAAASLWLRNRQRRLWQDQTTVKHEGAVDVNVALKAKTDEDIRAELAQMTARIATDVVDETPESSTALSVSRADQTE